MPAYTPTVAGLFIGACLAAASYTDYKARIIPNALPLLILAAGLFTAGVLWVKALYLLFTAIAIVVVEKAMKQHSGGGDIKLYLALSFALGPFSLALLLMLTLIFHSAYQAVMTHRNKATGKDARFPLACFLFPSYLIYFSFLLISR